MEGILFNKAPTMSLILGIIVISLKTRKTLKSLNTGKNGPPIGRRTPTTIIKSNTFQEFLK